MTDKRRDIEPITLDDALATIAMLSNFVLRLLDETEKAAGRSAHDGLSVAGIALSVRKLDELNEFPVIRQDEIDREAG